MSELCSQSTFRSTLLFHIPFVLVFDFPLVSVGRLVKGCYSPFAFHNRWKLMFVINSTKFILLVFHL